MAQVMRKGAITIDGDLFDELTAIAHEHKCSKNEALRIWAAGQGSGVPVSSGVGLAERLPGVDGRIEEHLRSVDIRLREHLDRNDATLKEHLRQVAVRTDEHLKLVDSRIQEHLKLVDSRISSNPSQVANGHVPGSESGEQKPQDKEISLYDMFLG